MSGDEGLTYERLLETMLIMPNTPKTYLYIPCKLNHKTGEYEPLDFSLYANDREIQWKPIVLEDPKLSPWTSRPSIFDDKNK